MAATFYIQSYDVGIWSFQLIPKRYYFENQTVFPEIKIIINTLPMAAQQVMKPQKS